MEENSLSLSFSKSISDEMSGIVSEYTELGLDALLEDGVLKDIPIVSTAVSIYKIGKSFREKYHISKLVSFLDEINKGICDEVKRQEYQDKFYANEKFRNQELEYILVLIDRYISMDKPRMLAKLYLAYLNGEMDWLEFTKYAEIVDRFLPGDKESLIREQALYHEIHVPIPDAFLRLASFGIYEEYMTDIIAPTTIGSITIPAKQEKTFKTTEFGEKLIIILGE